MKIQKKNAVLSAVRSNITHSSKLLVAFSNYYYCTRFFPHPMYYPCTALALPPSSITQIRGHIPGPPAPAPLRYMPSFYYANNSAFSFLIDSRRSVPTHHAARRFQQLVDLCFSVSANIVVRHHNGVNLTQAPTLVAVFEGNHLTTGATGSIKLIRDIQSAISSTRSTTRRKQPKTICQLRISTMART